RQRELDTTAPALTHRRRASRAPPRRRAGAATTRRPRRACTRARPLSALDRYSSRRLTRTTMIATTTAMTASDATALRGDPPDQMTTTTPTAITPATAPRPALGHTRRSYGCPDGVQMMRRNAPTPGTLAAFHADDEGSAPFAALAAAQRAQEP